MTKEKTIIISGCNGNIGKNTAKKFKDNNWHVVGIDIKPGTNEYIDLFYECDVRNAEKIGSIIASIEKETPVEVLFNTAGYEINTGFEETNMAEWEKLLDTILGGASNLCQVQAPYMVKRKRGKIILLSADYSRVNGDCIMNATANGSLHGFGKSFGAEMTSENVLVNVLFANAPFDLEKVAETVFYLADKDTYTSAQVVSVTGKAQAGGVGNEI